KLISGVEMNKIFLIIVLSIVAHGVFAQQAGQLYITSYDKWDPFFFCNGEPMMSGKSIDIAFANIASPAELIVDSFKVICDTSIFIGDDWIESMKNKNIGIGSELNLIYTPKKVGIDTLTIIGYYGPFSSTGTIICHAIDAPPIAFYGVEMVLEDFGGGFKIGTSDEVLRKDTLHDQIYSVPLSKTPINLHLYTTIDHITIRTCGTRTIDRIFWAGDSTEIQVNGIPPLPYTMHSGGSLSMPFSITPQKLGSFPHYFIIHTTDDDYLVWSFEYKVFSNSGVIAYNSPPEELDALVFPNPIRSSQGSVQIVSAHSAVANLKVISLGGSEVLNLGQITLSEGSMTIPLDMHLPNGTYLLLIETESGGIARKIIVQK
ncbi:MAG TPA: T9SS type A sorting domain-containing protein, partial [Candidatus Kapabacteria bacterium]|nr:T9SS type A sorting domain-containing protein [Candidatus Kapabacteria bacterium]